MNQQFVDFEDAEKDLLACATYLTQKIGSADGHAEAVKEIVPYYLEKDNVDLAAQLADSVEDTFVRDRLLIDVAEKCASVDDDEYALQLADAIEDIGLQSMAFERVALQKADKNEFEKAFEYIESLSHPSDAMAGIAVRQMLNSNEEEALKTISDIEFPGSKVSALQEMAEINLQKGDAAKTIEYLDKAAAEAEAIDFDEEKIRTLISIANHFAQVERKDRTIEILAGAQTLAEALPGINRENFLANISVSFLRAGSVDLADRVLDLVENKTLIASALTSFAAEFDKNGEREEALETLDEAYAIIKSEHDREIRDSRSRFGIMGTIAVSFAALGDSQRAVEAALENPLDSERYSALKQIAQIDALADNDEFALQAVNAIDESSEKAFALIGVSEAKKKTGKDDESLKYLEEAYEQRGSVKQNFLRSTVFNWLAAKFFEHDEKEKAREISIENLQTILQIKDESHRAIAVAHLARLYENMEFEMNEKEKEILNGMLRKVGI